METVGIICEYNPFHNGHARQLRLIRQAMGEDCAVVCLMSGNYVQRGEPAVFPKMLRAEAALRCGANLVLELPLTAALSSAEGFAFSGVSILSELGCDRLCFGVETRDTEALLCSAKANLDPRFDGLLRQQLDSGCSYAAARQLALEALGAGAGLSSPNDILAVEYCKALLRLNSPMHPLPLYRTGSYHAPEPIDRTRDIGVDHRAPRGARWGRQHKPRATRPSATRAHHAVVVILELTFWYMAFPTH